MKLQSVLLPRKEICDVEEMYFHREGDWILFDGFFNLFYLEKHHKYCKIDSLSLELEIKGFKRLVIMHDNNEIHKEDFESRPISGRERIRAYKEKRQLNEWSYAQDIHRLSLKIPYEFCKTGVLWFKAEISPKFIEDDSWYIRGHFEGNASKIAPVEIAVNICTFKREPYVLRNMKSLLEWADGENAQDIDGKRPEAAEHMHVFIVDNGRTLSSTEEFKKAVLEKEKSIPIKVIPNANTGGTGGFSQGMREAIVRKQELSLTHLLMMDDDAVFDPDMFVRLYGILSLLRDEYKEITVGGALFREDYRYVQHAAGEWFSDFKVINEHPLVDMRDFKNCSADWMTEPLTHNNIYGAWWCCCYNMSAITPENIPLPIFVHHDDIQFGMKQADRGILFINGIGVWHQGFELVFPGTKQYYNMRNTLITMEMFEPERLKQRIKYWSIRRYIGMLISYRYGDCELIHRAMIDFKKGKGWIQLSDPEANHKEVSDIYRKACDMKPVEELEITPDERKQVFAQIDALGQFTIDKLRNYYTPDRFTGPNYKKASFNGWFFPRRKGIKVITPLDSPWDTYRYAKIVLYEPGTGKAAIMKRSNKEFFKGIGRIIKFALFD